MKFYKQEEMYFNKSPFCSQQDNLEKKVEDFAVLFIIFAQNGFEFENFNIIGVTYSIVSYCFV